MEFLDKHLISCTECALTKHRQEVTSDLSVTLLLT